MSDGKMWSQGYVRVPFSWEEKPGIPKYCSKNEERSVAPPPAPAPQQKRCYRYGKGHDVRRWRDDPFLAALKSCTKGDDHIHTHVSFKESKSSFFSCKHSCTVVDDNLVNFSKLPPIPKERYYARSFVRNSH